MSGNEITGGSAEQVGERLTKLCHQADLRVGGNGSISLGESFLTVSWRAIAATTVTRARPSRH